MENGKERMRMGNTRRRPQSGPFIPHSHSPFSLLHSPLPFYPPAARLSLHPASLSIPCATIRSQSDS
jgi:hypothetical protein